MTWLVIIVCGIAVGTPMGALGGGGGILIVPVLIYVAGLSAGEASMVAKLVVGLSSGVSSMLYYRSGLLSLRHALLMAACGAPGAILGSQLSTTAPRQLLTLILGSVVFVVALTMLLRRRPPEQSDEGQAPRSQLVWPAVVAGTGVGFLTGLLGVGGGFLIVPALVLMGLPMKRAVGTSLAVMCLNASVGIVSAINSPVPWDIAFAFASVTLMATMFGVAVAHRLEGQQLQTAFAVVLLLLGAYLLYDSLVGSPWGSERPVAVGIRNPFPPGMPRGDDN